MADSSGPVSVERIDGDVVVVRMDDGKVNALSHELIAAVDNALNGAVADKARALVLLGREGRFSAGFDLKVMGAGPEAARDMLTAGARLAHRLYTYPMPVVMGCTGHALAMGAILLFAGDVRIGADGDFKIGMNEVAIGMPVPRFAVELARDRLLRPQFQHATLLARIYEPAEAVEAGYLDRAVNADWVEESCVAEAVRLAASLHPAAFLATRETVRAPVADRLLDLLAQDVSTFLVAD